MNSLLWCLLKANKRKKADLFNKIPLHTSQHASAGSGMTQAEQARGEE